MQGDIIPDFNEHGVLPEGIYNCTINDLFTRFVIDITPSNTREPIFLNYTRFNKEKLNYNLKGYYWLDGSFVTNKLDPHDIDVVMIIESSDENPIENQNKQMILELNSQHDYIKNKYSTDFRAIIIKPKEHPDYLFYKKHFDKWKNFWSKHTVGQDPNRTIIGKKGFLSVSHNAKDRNE
jgi:hypothetical protein